jgi:hypothetical protein
MQGLLGLRQFGPRFFYARLQCFDQIAALRAGLFQFGGRCIQTLARGYDGFLQFIQFAFCTRAALL